MPIVLIAKALRDAQRGATLIVQADDRAFPEDVRAWCRKMGQELVSLEHRPGYYQAVIKKA
jgi:TusA-related sulfurtransferase